MNKTDFELLGNIFDTEIDNQLPYQSQDKRYLELESKGMVQLIEETRDFNDGLPQIVIKGWILTQKGHLEYCEACSAYCPESE